MDNEIISLRKGIINLLTEEEKANMHSLFAHVCSIPFKSHRDNHFDKLSIFDCILEIINSGADNAKKAAELCHKIQNYMSNEEVRSGWRVSFACKDKSHRFYYLNDRLRLRRKITFGGFLI